MFEKLDTFCKYPGCGRVKASHTFDEWEQHKQMQKLRTGSGNKNAYLVGIGFGALIMSWTIIAYGGLMTWVFK